MPGSEKTDLKRIFVLADTHATSWQQLPEAVRSGCLTSDYVLHLGDFDSIELLEEFRSFNNFLGVAGNHDGPSLGALLQPRDIVEIDGWRIGLVHGHGCFWPRGIRPGLRESFQGERLDALLYGHTHLMNNKLIGDTLFFNPGSTAGRWPARRGSYGILSVNGSLTGRLFTIDEIPAVDENLIAT